MLSFMKSANIEPNEKSMNLLLKAYATSGDAVGVEKILKGHLVEGLPLDTHKANCLLTLITNTPGEVDWIKFNETITKHFVNGNAVADRETYAEIFAACIKAGRSRDAVIWFDDLLKNYRVPMSFSLWDIFYRCIGDERATKYVSELPHEYRVSLSNVDTDGDTNAKLSSSRILRSLKNKKDVTATGSIQQTSSPVVTEISKVQDSSSAVMHYGTFEKAYHSDSLSTSVAVIATDNAECSSNADILPIISLAEEHAAAEVGDATVMTEYVAPNILNVSAVTLSEPFVTVSTHSYTALEEGATESKLLSAVAADNQSQLGSTESSQGTSDCQATANAHISDAIPSPSFLSATLNDQHSDMSPGATDQNTTEMKTPPIEKEKEKGKEKEGSTYRRHRIYGATQSSTSDTYSSTGGVFRHAERPVISINTESLTNSIVEFLKEGNSMSAEDALLSAFAQGLPPSTYYTVLCSAELYCTASQRHVPCHKTSYISAFGIFYTLCHLNFTAPRDLRFIRYGTPRCSCEGALHSRQHRRC